MKRKCPGMNPKNRKFCDISEYPRLSNGKRIKKRQP
jgi:hypothetical protein